VPELAGVSATELERRSLIPPGLEKWETHCDLSKEALTELETDMLAFIWMLFIGLIVGALAKLVMPGHDPGGILVTMLLGIAGALVAGFVGRHLGLYEPGQSAGFIISTLGAILLLAFYRLVKRRSHAV
jgi:uncharacterized membrane protein YeaQ/YmgE (transglycosylase-associated protein family)